MIKLKQERSDNVMPFLNSLDILHYDLNRAVVCVFNDKKLAQLHRLKCVTVENYFDCKDRVRRITNNEITWARHICVDDWEEGLDWPHNSLYEEEGLMWNVLSYIQREVEAYRTRTFKQSAETYAVVDEETLSAMSTKEEVKNLLISVQLTDNQIEHIEEYYRYDIKDMTFDLLDEYVMLDEWVPQYDWDFIRKQSNDVKAQVIKHIQQQLHHEGPQSLYVVV